MEVELVTQYFPQVHVVTNGSNIGFAATNNKGIKISIDLGAGYIFLVNLDTRTLKELIMSLVEFMGINPGFCVIGPLQTVYGQLQSDNLPLNKCDPRINWLTNKYIQHKGGGSTKISYYKKKLMMRNKYYFLITDPTWSMTQIRELCARWLKFDLKNSYSHELLLFLNNCIWVVSILPKALIKRYKYRNLTKNNFIQIIDNKGKHTVKA